MDNRNDGLWQGGLWERPASPPPLPPAVNIPEYAMRPRTPVLRRKRRRARRWPWFAGLLTLVLVLVGATVFLERQFRLRGYQETLPGDRWSGEEAHSTQPPSIPQAATGTGVTLELEAPGGESLSYPRIYEKNVPSRVSIQAQGRGEYSTGTGIIMTPDGYIITNAHVVAGTRAVRVVLHDYTSYPASLVGFDAREDLAVLKVEAQGLTPAEFGDSAALHPGDPVAALGDPLGYSASITDGIVSALDREVTIEGETMVLIQTSAAINYGNSGGPLINEYGQVVGITTIKIVNEDGSAEGLGFAIPSRRVKYVVDALIDGREIRTGIFGFTVSRLPVEGGGLELLEVRQESDAWAKGLRAGDVILSAGGLRVNGTEDLTRLKQSKGPGDLIELVCRRDGEIFTVSVALIEG